MQGRSRSYRACATRREAKTDPCEHPGSSRSPPGARRTLNRPARLADWVNIRSSAWSWQGNPNHAVTCNDRSQLLLGPVLRACGTYWKDHEAALLIGVFNTYIDLGGEDQTELSENLARPPYQSAPIVRRPVPL